MARKANTDPNASPVDIGEIITHDEQAKRDEQNFQDRQLGEPIEDAYPDGQFAEVSSAAHKPSETIVEHPLAPTDTNPNPHGTRDEPDFVVTETNDKGVAHRKLPDDLDVEVEGLVAEGVHLGDGRVLSQGSTMMVTKEQAKTLRKNKQVR